jgi:hypothetical protein
MSNIVHKSLAPLSKWVHILWLSRQRCPEVVKESNKMPAKLTTSNKIKTVPNSVNAEVIEIRVFPTLEIERFLLPSNGNVILFYLVTLVGQ